MARRLLFARLVRLVGMAIAVAACHQAEPARAPLPLACAEDRVGKVIVDGGSKADVPELAVLEGTLDDQARTDRIVGVSTDLLHARGYSRAAIEVERRQGCGVELVVHLDRGPHFKLSRIVFETDDAFPAKARLAAIEDALGTVNAVGGAFVADRLGRALEGLKRQYQDAGWLDVEIDRADATYDDDVGEVSLTIPVRAGQRYKLGSVVARGGERATRARVIDVLGLHGGDWYDGRAIREAIRRARREVGGTSKYTSTWPLVTRRSISKPLSEAVASAFARGRLRRGRGGRPPWLQRDAALPRRAATRRLLEG